MWPKPIHPYLLHRHGFRLKLMPVRCQLKAIYTYDQLVELETETLVLLMQLELSIIMRHERIVGKKIDLVTDGKHRNGLRTLNAALYRVPYSDSKVVRFCSRDNLKHIHCFQEL